MNAETIPDAAMVAAAFRLGRPTGLLSEVARGAMGRVWRLTTESGDYAAKQLFAWARGEDRIDIEARVVEAAIGAGIATPAMIRSAAGRFIEPVGPDRWRLFTWMSLAPALTPPVGEAEAVQLGEVLAALHRLNLAADPAGVIPWFRNRQAESRWRGLAARVREAAPPWAGAFRAALPALIELAAIADPQAHIGPSLLSHCDLSSGNVFLGERGAVLLDWEHAGAIPPLWELGCVIATWCMGENGVDDHAAARALVAAYREAGGEGGPLGLEIFAGHISAIQNWTLSRVYIAVAGDDPAERVRAGEDAVALITHPISRARLEAMVEALGA